MAGPSEREFQEQVVQLARLRGWRVLWVRPVRVQRRGGAVYHETPFGADGKGWPDLFLLRKGQKLALELKVKKNRPTDAQKAWIAELNAARIPTFVLYPKDWPEIEELLRR